MELGALAESQQRWFVKTNAATEHNDVTVMPKKSSHAEPKDQDYVYECHCHCPNWGKWPPEGISVVRDKDCGHTMDVCNLCLLEGRITRCRKCDGGFAE